jgi:GrpB-like predicted nucleotidyltransferase (UPF0157 family)
MIEKRQQIIEVTSYNVEWPNQFLDEAKCIKHLFSHNFSSIYHIGSTAVPGMPAKPTLDILLVVKDINQVDHLNDDMDKLGYEAWGEYGIAGRRFFVKGENKRTHHVHTLPFGSAEIARHLFFRDFLIAHPARAKEYARLKIDLARRFADKRRDYVMAKQGVVKAIEQEAIAWAHQKDRR